MPLILTVKSYQRLSPDQESTKTVSQGRLSIGRSTEADWSLPDPERQISKFHCNIDALGDSYILTDTSTNGVFINGATVPVGRDNKVGLSSGDQIRLGEYEIEVSVGEMAQPGAGEQDTTAGPVSALEDPFNDPLLAGLPSGEVETPNEALPDVPKPRYDDDGLLSDLDDEQRATPAEQPRLLGVPSGTEAETAPPPGAAPDHLPGDKAFFEAPQLVSAEPAPKTREDGLLRATPTPETGGTASGAIPEDWDDDPEVAPEDAPEDAPGDTSGNAPGDHPLAPAPPEVPSEPSGGAIPEDWDLDTGGLEPQPNEPALPELEGTDETDLRQEAPPAEDPSHSSAPTSPETVPQEAPLGIDDTYNGRLKPESFVPKPQARAEAAGQQDGGSEAVLQAFFEGAELEVPPASGEDAEAVMRDLGQIYRILVQGMMEVLAARSSLKNEFRVEQTMIQPVQNNPLKFAANVDNAMENLLLKRGKGYMPATEAMREAFGDLQAHQIATLAGMQSALQSVVARFDPEKLEKRLDRSSLLDSILPGSRKARYWNTFQQLYNEIAKEAEDDFQKLFGEAFAKAYEKETKKR